MAKNPYWDKPTPELVAIGEAIRNDPKNANPAHSAGRDIYLYTPAAPRKLDQIAWAITANMSHKQTDFSGYSGRNSNRRS